MEILTNANRKRLVSIAENYIDDILEDRGNNIEDLASGFSNAGFTKSEFFQILDKYYFKDYIWAEEKENVNIENSNLAILETVLTQIGIPYTWENSYDGNGSWIDLKFNYNHSAAKIFFTKDGTCNGIELTNNI